MAKGKLKLPAIENATQVALKQALIEYFKWHDLMIKNQSRRASFYSRKALLRIYKLIPIRRKEILDLYRNIPGKYTRGYLNNNDSESDTNQSDTTQIKKE